MTTTTKTQCVLYLSPIAENRQSLDAQEARCRAYAAARDYEVTFVFRELDTSDSEPEDLYAARPELYRAVLALKPEMILLVTQHDQIGYSAECQGIVQLDVARHGCRIETVDKPNEESPDERERLLVVARNRAAMQHYQDHRRRMGRIDRVPYGFRVDPRNASQLIPDDQEQQTLLLIAEYANYHPTATQYDVCRYLDRIRHPRRGGKTWKNAHRIVEKIMQKAKDASGSP